MTAAMTRGGGGGGGEREDVGRHPRGLALIDSDRSALVNLVVPRSDPLARFCFSFISDLLLDCSRSVGAQNRRWRSPGSPATSPGPVRLGPTAVRTP